jgi:uncharacterized protein (TIGR00730 family)
MRISVYAASSAQVRPAFVEAARSLGRILAAAGHTIVYGGGGTGLMGAVADGALEAGGEVIGVIPRFMTEVEWQHPGIARLDVVEDMRERKHRLLTGSDAVVALPGGCGTVEELVEAITLKRLGLYFNPIVLVNLGGFWDLFQRFLLHTIEERMMSPAHAAMWSLVDRVEDVLPRIHATPEWPRDARRFAAVAAP